MTPFPLRCAALCLLILPLGASSQTALPNQSPFAPTSGPRAAATAANETLEFAGVSSVGKRTDVIIHDKASKRKHWIPIGETVEGISVLKYDPKEEQATVRVNGAEKVLPLRKPGRPGQGPAPVQPLPAGFNVPAPVQVVTPAPVAAQTEAAPAPAPAAPPTPQTPEAQAKAETEARMLVSDLLEIGMAQRKAYEEAQRKAAAGGAGQPTQPPTPGQAPTPAQPGANQASPAMAAPATPPPAN